MNQSQCKDASPPRRTGEPGAGSAPPRVPAPFLSEAQLQAATASFLDIALPTDAIAHHSANEGKRGWVAQRSLKASGAKKGWPDVEIIWQGRAYFIELKSEKGRVSPDQAKIHTRLWDAGAAVVICRTLEAVENALRSWAIPLRTSLMARVA
jgi:VRR-NUC domain